MVSAIAIAFELELDDEELELDELDEEDQDPDAHRVLGTCDARHSIMLVGCLYAVFTPFGFIPGCL